MTETVKKYLVQAVAALALVAATFCVTQGVNNKIYRGGLMNFKTTTTNNVAPANAPANPTK